MAARDILRARKSMKSNWTYYALILFVVEKIIQHFVVTLAFYFDWRAIGSTVAVSPILLMYLGALIAILFILCFWGMLRKQLWSLNLIIFLALFDILGEFVAQGKIGIVITVSIISASLLLLLALIYRRQLHTV